MKLTNGIIESTPLQYSTDNEIAFYKSSHVDFPEEIARQIERKSTEQTIYQLILLTHGP